MRGLKNMSIFKLLFLASAITLVTLSAGLALCPPDMEYFASTDSCFQFSNLLNNTFFKCRDECREIRGGENKNVKGHMAWILDSVTDKYIKGQIKDKTAYWIGLNDGETKGVYSWVDRQNTVSYYGWTDGYDPTKGDIRGVVVYKDGWEKSDRSSQKLCLCEVKAAYQQVSMSSRLPLQVGKKGDQAISCFFSGPWTEVSLYLPPSKTEVVRCTRPTGGSPDCGDNCIDGYTPRLQGDSGDSGVSVDIANVKRRDGGVWTCEVTYGEYATKPQTQEVKVFETPREIHCNHTLSTSSLQVDCKTPRIFPAAACLWHYKQQDDQDFQRVTILDGDTSIKDERYQDNESAQFWESTCSLVLRKVAFTFLPGTLTLRVTMDPDIEGRGDIDNDISVTKDHDVSIVKPRPPKFKYRNGTRTGESITLLEGQQLHLVCFDYQGVPRVDTTTLRCNFSLSVDIKNQEFHKIVPGKSVSVKISANKIMNGKCCDCYGQHLTGDTMTTRLGFNVLYPAGIASFSTNRRSNSDNYIYQTGEMIDIMCQTDGNPRPNVTITRSGAGQELRKFKHTRTQDLVYHRLTTKCSDNGQYFCQANNVISGNPTTVNQSLILGVHCNPTVCPYSDFNKTVGANIGDIARIKFCMNAYPAPTTNRFEIYSTKTKTAVNKNDYSLQYTPRTNGRDELSVDYKMETDKTFGTYEVRYNQQVIASFQIKLKGAPFCPDEITVQSIGVNEMLLEWNRPLSHKIGENFVIFDVSSGSPQEMAEISDLDPAGEGRMAYNLTGLEHDTTYNLSVGTRNTHGNRICLKNMFNATTEALTDMSGEVKDSWFGSNILYIIAGGAALLLLIIIVIMAVFCRKKKQPGWTPETPKDTSESDDDDVKNGDDQDEMVYAKVDKKSKGSKTPKKKTTDNDDDKAENVDDQGQVVYAKVDKKSKGSKASTSAPANDECLYASVDKKGKGKKKGKVTINPEAVNATTPGEDTVYANDLDGAGVQDGASGEGGEGGAAEAADWDNKELVYISVSIGDDNKVTLNKGEQTPKPTKPPQLYEAVEYSSIDVLATKHNEINLLENKARESQETGESQENDEKNKTTPL